MYENLRLKKADIGFYIILYKNYEFWRTLISNKNSKKKIRKTMMEKCNFCILQFK